MTTGIPQQIGQILMLLTQDFQRRLDQDLQAREVKGISVRYRGVFLHLGQYGPSRAVDLAQAAGMRPQSMMAIVHELEELGLVKRCPDPTDSRAKLVDFTDVGRELIAELTGSTEAVWQQYADILGEQELTNTFQAMQTLLDRSREVGQN